MSSVKYEFKIRKRKNNNLYRFPIVAACVLRWIEFSIFDPSSFVHSILEYMKKRWEQQDTDVSLIRHFMFEVTEIINLKMKF
jgi:hypothetical protein